MHKTGSNDVWSFICINLNLPLSECFKEDNIIPFGIAPGPKAPSDLDSFLYPFVEEMKRLSETGVRCYDAKSQHYFELKVHVVLCTGIIVESLVTLTNN